MSYESIPADGRQGMPASPQDLPADATALGVEDLAINTEYHVMVWASTATGQGAKAEQIGHTDEDGKDKHILAEAY